MTNTHEYTLSVSTHPGGKRFGVNFNGSPLMAVSPDRERAWLLLVQQNDRATLRRQPIRLMGWNGDTGDDVEVVDLVGGRYAVVVRGVQWGPRGSPVGSNGAADADWSLPLAALRAWYDEQ